MSRIQFNLLPDVKMEYVKAQRTKHLVIMVSVLVAGIALGSLLILLAALGVQKQQLKGADNDIKRYTADVKKINNLDRILTVQNQLVTLTSLHEQKHVASRLFVYLPQVTPANINIGKISVDFAGNTIEIAGTTDSLASVNKFIDTLKFTTYKLNAEDETTKQAFPSVVETSYGLDSKGASYTLSVQFDPELFINSNKVTLVVPVQTTTRSVLNDTTTIFNGQTGPSQQPSGQTTTGGTR